MLNDRELAIVDSTDVINDLNSPSAAAAGRLHDPHVWCRLSSGWRAASLQIAVFFSNFRETLDEQAILFRKHKRFGADVEVLRQLATCSRVPVNASLQKVFASQVLVLRKMIDFLPDAQTRIVQFGLAPCP